MIKITPNCRERAQAQRQRCLSRYIALLQADRAVMLCEACAFVVRLRIQEEGMLGKSRSLRKRGSVNRQLAKAGRQPALKMHDYSCQLLNPQGKECLLIQKRHNCFCGHRFDSHACLANALHCATLGCPCKSYEYVPSAGVKCICKHSSQAHSQGRKCEKCQCGAFASDIYCKCGYRLAQHNSHLALAAQKENGKHSLPALARSYQRQDQVLEKLSRSMLQQAIIQQESIDYGEKQASSEHTHEQYLKAKLQQANKRYLAKFQEHGKQGKEEQRHAVTAFDLYMQPHFYQNVSLTKFIHETLLQ